MDIERGVIMFFIYIIARVVYLDSSSGVCFAVEAQQSSSAILAAVVSYQY